MSGAEPGSGPFSARVVAILLAVSMMAFAGVVGLSAWAPELRERDRAGAHPYSTSALGYGGLVRLLDLRATPVTVSRQPDRLERNRAGLMVITLDHPGMGRALEDIELAQPVLIVLPKWDATPDPVRPKRQLQTRLASPDRIERALSTLAPEANIVRADMPGRLDAPFGRFEMTEDGAERLQLVRGGRLSPVVTAGEDGMLLAQLSREDVYILADPDFLNTFGLAHRDRAGFSLAMLDWLRPKTGGPVILDATLHGFERTRSLLRLALDLPFLGATLVALAAFLMLGWSGAVRFARPRREARAIALGKQALTDSTAGLFVMTRREPRLAPGYLALTRRAAARAAGAPKSLDEAELTELFDRMTGEPADQRFSTLAEGLNQPAQSREDLIMKARRLWRWRQEITHGHN